MQPAELGRYRITGVLGRGGMGVVYAGHDPQIDRPVAIKTIALDALSEAEKAIFEARFRAEMRSAGRLQHHNIAALYDTGRDGGTAYIVMELVPGQDLRRRLATGGRLPVAQAIDIAAQLLAALEFAHRRHVIHRDVKPANVMLQDDGVVKLCDFGVARLADADATRTQGLVVGSLRYASPEQIAGQFVDARSDLFSTGVLLYELLTGEPPFKGQTDVEILHRIATEPAPSARAQVPEIPAEVDAAIRRALSKDPEDRFASAIDFARALGATPQGSPDSPPAHRTTAATLPDRAAAPHGAEVKPPAGAPPAARLRPGFVVAALGAAVSIGVASWVAWKPRRPAEPAAQQAVTQKAAAGGGQASSANRQAASSASSAAAVAPARAPSAPSAPSAATTAAAAAPPPAPARPEPAASLARPAAAAASAKAAPTSPPPEPHRWAEGAWNGQLACSALINPRRSSTRLEPFTAKVAIEISGNRIRWVRDSKTAIETAAGQIDASGRFSAQGEGWEKDGEKRSNGWRVTAGGQLHARDRRIEARAQILRLSDGSVARECTLRAQRS